ncbi:hypothetical protein [Flavobacterium selenitireducens]|uniref:hypothetical protein n=1 Tax=Flavobacterium selenitireducens TaxID=2722704 RepID=UPI00168A787C|nr:hypothetical protein [Flavobacterium selenitireducens]MBD3581737.1 hypothetical protein [Flavobacterium selenitireducens]
MKTTILPRAGLLIFWLFIALACKQTGPETPAGIDATDRSLILPFAETDTPSEPEKSEASTATGKVWVCKSSGAKKYHFNRDCGGLKRCTHTIEESTVKQAEAVGLGQCSYKKCR